MIIIQSKKLYDKYFELCKDILYIDDMDTKLVNEIRKFTHKSEFEIYTESWTPIINILTKEQTKKLKWLYTSYMDNRITAFKHDYIQLLKLYDLIDIDSTTHLSIPPIIKGVELFGTCVNTYNNEFCSMFEFEKKFGSLGSFWDYKFHKNGIYISNPPFNISFIRDMADKLIKDLSETEFDIIIVQVLPIWDSFSQRMIKSRNFNLGFEGYTKLIECDFFKEKMILDKDSYQYINHCKEKTTASSNTHLIMLSNLPDDKYKKIITIDKIAERWNNFVY
ncbi:MAG: hypothetical protein ACRCZI_13100 [Cetobacterium sp.]